MIERVLGNYNGGPYSAREDTLGYKQGCELGSLRQPMHITAFSRSSHPILCPPQSSNQVITLLAISASDVWVDNWIQGRSPFGGDEVFRGM